jgi:hypothetical protein
VNTNSLSSDYGYEKKLTKSWSFSNLVSLLQKHLFSYVNFVDFFNNVDSYAKEFVRNKENPDDSQGKFEFQKNK